MNKIEREMFSLLKELRDSYGAVGLKAEFEAEGTRVEELLRLLELGHRGGMKMALKIGGCEAVRDLIDAKQFGVNFIIAPMVETAYAVSKFIEAKNKVFDADDRADVDFLFNIETITGFENLSHILEAATIPDGCNGIVFGRVDFVGSKNMPRDSVDSAGVTAAAKLVGSGCKRFNLDLVVGGGVSNNALPALNDIKSIHLTRFETRKVIFDESALSIPGFERGLLLAVHFELLWLLNKREFYKAITDEDDKRIEMLEKRWKVLSEKY
jgi:acetylornithine deacetylase/succinyl-diaminopimelate desuccinylase-like protein